LGLDGPIAQGGNQADLIITSEEVAVNCVHDVCWEGMYLIIEVD
jgi:hypothetical protein